MRQHAGGLSQTARMDVFLRVCKNEHSRGEVISHGRQEPREQGSAQLQRKAAAREERRYPCARQDRAGRQEVERDPAPGRGHGPLARPFGSPRRSTANGLRYDTTAASTVDASGCPVARYVASSGANRALAGVLWPQTPTQGVRVSDRIARHALTTSAAECQLIDAPGEVMSAIRHTSDTGCAAKAPLTGRSPASGARFPRRRLTDALAVVAVPSAPRHMLRR